MKILIVLLIAVGFHYSQTTYEIPFASEGNEIELEILNDSDINLSNVKVDIFEKPEWIKFEESEKVMTNMQASKEKTVTFKFNIDQEAKVMEESTLKFQISGNNQTWGKEIKISVLPPDKFELNQNYPNPFNPTTTISYTIPAVASSFSLSQKVHLAIYDILGREVETLVNNEQDPGYYKFEWNGNNYASGMYIYQVSINSKNSKREVVRKKMMLLK